MKKDITYGIYIYEQVAELDFVAPLQVFAASNQFAGGGRVVTLSGTNQPLCGLSGLRITPDYRLEEAPPLDVLLLPGTAEVSEYAWRDPNILDWVRQQYEKVDLVIPEESWGQKITDIKEYQIDTFVMGNDWTGKFDFIEESTAAKVIYLSRTPEISTTKIKKDLEIGF